MSLETDDKRLFRKHLSVEMATCGTRKAEALPYGHNGHERVPHALELARTRDLAQRVGERCNWNPSPEWVPWALWPGYHGRRFRAIRELRLPRPPRIEKEI